MIFLRGMNLKNSINKYSKSKNARTVITNFSWLAVSQVAGYVFPLLTIPYLARVIGAEGFGLIAFAIAIIAWIQTIVDWGFNFTATRDVAQCNGNKEDISVIFSNVLWARLILSFICLIFLFVLSIFIPSFWENRVIIFVTFLMIPGHILCPEWFFQAIEKMKFITLMNFLLKLIFTFGVFVFIKDSDDVVIQPLLTSGGYIVCGIISFYLIVIKWKYKIYSPNFQKIFVTLKGSFDIFLNNLLPNLYNSFSILLLGIWGQPTSTGILDAGNKFVNICIQLMSVISRAFFPYLSRKIEKHSFYESFSLWIAGLMSLGLFFAAPIVIKIFFTLEFEPAIMIMRIMAISNFFLTLNSVYGTGYLIIVGKERLLRNINFVLSLFGFAISFPLVYFFDYIGAALTITVTRGMIGLTEMYWAKKLKFNPAL